MPSTRESILSSVKKLNNIPTVEDSFDDDIILWTNGALAVLNQLGIGPFEGFQIEDASDTWDDFIDEDPRFNTVKNYVALYVRLRFDPPKTSFTITMMEDQLNEMAHRLIVLTEDIEAEEAENV